MIKTLISCLMTFGLLMTTNAQKIEYNEYILIEKFIVHNIFFLKRKSSKLMEHTVLRYELYKTII